MAERAFISPSYEIPGFTKKQNAALRRILFEVEGHGPHEGSSLRFISIKKTTGETFATDVEKRLTFDTTFDGAISVDSGELRWSTADPGTIHCDGPDTQSYFVSLNVDFAWGTETDGLLHYKIRIARLEADTTETPHEAVVPRTSRFGQTFQVIGMFEMKAGQGVRTFAQHFAGVDATVKARLHVFGPIAGLLRPPGI